MSGWTPTLDSGLPNGWRRKPLDHGLVTEALAFILDELEVRSLAEAGSPHRRARAVLDELFERMKRGRATVREVL